jgi:hypothetical protein
VERFSGQVADQPEPVRVRLASIVISLPSLSLVGRFETHGIKETVGVRIVDQSYEPSVFRFQFGDATFEGQGVLSHHFGSVAVDSSRRESANRLI